jgi:hypothetical protein
VCKKVTSNDGEDDARFRASCIIGFTWPCNGIGKTSTCCPASPAIARPASHPIEPRVLRSFRVLG